jgi:S1-C subfamily serine protease
MRKCIIVPIVVFVALLARMALADTLTMKDGTKVEGRVIPQGDRYWVKLADGSTKYIEKDKVASFSKGDSPSAAPVPASVAGGATKPASPASSGSFASVRSKAELVESPDLAVQMWQKFIDANPSPADLAQAKTELSKWQKLSDTGAEKINGKWIGGDEKKELLKNVREMVEEGYKAIENNQSLEGTKKLEEAMKIYPNSFEVNYLLGYFYLVKGAIGANGHGNIAYQEKAVKCLETATKLNPMSAGAWSNLAICYNSRGRYADAVQAAYKAVKIEDTKGTVQNLVSAFAYAPPGMQSSNEKMKPILEDAAILAGKYGINPRGGGFVYIAPKPPKEDALVPSEVADAGKPGPAWGGSGFFISADGYLITNHHVATGDPKGAVQKNISFLVRMDDGSEKNAELIAVDDKADIALMKVKTDSPVSYLKIADDNPRQAAQALVLGYPATGLEQPSMQVSAGDVASINPGDKYEVWFHLSTTHGNSGGPIVDKSGRLIAILSGGREVYNVVYVMGVGPKQIKTFLATLGDKSPKVEYAPAGTGEFNGETLTEQAKKATLLITAIRGEKP